MRSAASFTDPEAARAAFAMGPVRFRCAACGGVHEYRRKLTAPIERCLERVFGAGIGLPFSFFERVSARKFRWPFWLEWHPARQRWLELRRSLERIETEFQEGLSEALFAETWPVWVLALEEPYATCAAMRERARLLEEIAALFGKAAGALGSAAPGIWEEILQIEAALAADPSPRPLPDSVDWRAQDRALVVAVGGKEYSFSCFRVTTDLHLTLSEQDRTAHAGGYGWRLLGPPRFCPDRMEAATECSDGFGGSRKLLVVVERYRLGRVVEPAGEELPLCC